MSFRKRPDANIKVLLLGDTGVGKSALMLQYTENHFPVSFVATVGIDYKKKKIDIDGKSMVLEIWDTAGQERYKSITASYLRSAQGICLCYDVSNRQSFEMINQWVSQISTYACDNVDMILVGNKTDKPANENAVSTKEGQRLANLFGIPFFETSAKANRNVDEAFLALARSVAERCKYIPSGRNSIVLQKESPKNSFMETCCGGGLRYVKLEQNQD